jgi:leucyl/phenylalanyl-tRNA--protein transferase
MQLVLTPELLLEAYRHGLFPMAYSAGSPYVHWICPEKRGQLPIANLHIPRRLEKTLRKMLKTGGPFEIRINTAFRHVINACAEKREERPETWINDSIREIYCKLHALGHAHSVECWKDDALAGGLYGLELGGAFFGESMFSRERDASKIALAHLAARLWRGGFTLFDTQFVNDHIKQFGAYDIPHKEYMARLGDALVLQADFRLEDTNTNDIMESYLAMQKQSGA